MRWVICGFVLYVLVTAMVPRDLRIGLVVAGALGFGYYAVVKFWSARDLSGRFGLALPAVQLVSNARRWQNLMVALGLDRTMSERAPMSLVPRPVQYVPAVLDVQPASYGAVVRVQGVSGHSLPIWRSAAPQLASALGVGAVIVSEPTPNVFALALRVIDPLAEPLILEDVLLPASSGLLLGIDEQGEWLEMSYSNTSGCVIGGIPGSGKSAYLLQGLASLATDPAIQFALIDGKQGHDLSALAGRAYMYLTGDDAGDLTIVRDALSDVHVVMQQRLKRSIDLWDGQSNFWSYGPSQEHPLVVLVVDECQHYLDVRSLTSKEDKTLAAEIDGIIRDLVKRGRSAGILVVLLTQRPTAESIPTAIRDNCGLRVSFGVRTREAAVAVLGDLSSEDGVSPIGLPPGVGIASVNGELVRFRAPFVNDDLVSNVVRTHAGLTADPLDLLARALSSDVPDVIE
ncbi:FtsK/SpoIIIE domain-containing protein [Mycobacteroides abscessus]|nr:FtsK/SpoIIIE domain-containing protein [Mycobacteroides abscessus]SLH82381.1 FtsK/SpoIIIE family protein [Mycobacteroides abscessus subsp. abscessus]